MSQPLPKIVHMSSAHPPFDVRIFHRECVSLAQEGYPVSLVVPHQQDEVRQGVQICAVPVAKNRLGRMFGVAWAVYKRALAEKGDIYHFHDPELIPVGLLLQLQGKKVVYDVHEDVPTDILSKDWIPKWLRSLVALGMGLLERLAGAFLSGIVAVTEPIAARFPAHKTILLQNFPHPQEIASLQNLPYQTRPAQALYTGSITRVRGLFEMLDAMQRLPDTKLRLTLIGNFAPETLEAEAAQHPGFSRTDYLGYKNRPDTLALLSSSRIGLSILHPIPSFLVSQPTKLYEYMMAGMPFVASDFPLWRASIGHNNCGLFVDPRKPDAIAQAIQWLLDHPAEAEAMGQRGRRLVAEQLNWGVEFVKLKELYHRLSQPPALGHLEV
ncbi:glycosyltransferase family 4 protein [Meiothermus hypogaeus]|uniref:Glycosyl transferase n=2 Tax=Meiothermus hypogaeus TaxID=884155 RepID=A0A511QZN4_9DEIN|nr:glycosyltransferase family 4 protein [Meiothermus hypogaeus]RIH76906.1 PEP-CTERM/exosortase A-associated glycosyltransferase [Meiothermus hypogaeus]GEM82841.1 glycosyl transferase [Meiothermus hypogaeus NBRC 106114]GIW37321.1 MAG: glycosyl transferase [Meiothermus sp.]